MSHIYATMPLHIILVSCLVYTQHNIIAKSKQTNKQTNVSTYNGLVQILDFEGTRVEQ